MRRRKETSIGLLSFLAASSVRLADALQLSPPSPIDAPQLDYQRLGDVFLGGSFDGISQFTYEGQPGMLKTPRSDADDLIIQYGSDVYLPDQFATGKVSSSCALGDNQTFVLAGNFTSIFNESIENSVAAVNFANQTVTKMNPSVNGSQINTLYCNGSQVYAGGSFSLGGASGVAVWHQQNNSWTLPPFGGFVEDSWVNSIIPYGDHIVFGGNFSGLASKSSQNTSRNSSNLLKPGMQPVSFNLANATGYETQDTGSGGTNASSVLCPLGQGSGWNAGTYSTTGFVNVTLAYMSQPTRIRIYNLPDGSGTKTFRIVSQPAGSFMNLTYTDEQGKLQSCAAECPLPEYSETVRYTDFEFVNVVPTTSFMIQLLDFYGDHAGLKGVQLFEAGQFAFAFNAFNNPRQCGPSDSDTDSNSIVPSNSATTELKGSSSWSLVNDFMSTNITDKSKLTSTYAQMNPTFDSYVVDQGLYEVLLYTPGCESYKTCTQRGQVNVTVYPGFGTQHSELLYQTNNAQKYDLIYNGTLQEGAYIRITPVAQNNVPMNLVAYKVSLNYLGSPEKYNASTLFEYSEANFTTNLSTNIPIGQTPINYLGKQLGSSSVSVNSLLLNGTSNLLVGGSGFSSNVSTSPSLLTLPLQGSKGATGISGLGDNDNGETVERLYSLNGTIFALSSKQTYEFANASVVNSVDIGSMSTVTPFSFNSTNYWAFSPTSSTNATINLWNPSVRSFDTSSVSLRGHISGAFAVQNVTVYTGSMQIADSLSPNAAVLSERTEQPEIPAFMAKNKGVSKSASSSMKKRDLSSGPESVDGSIYGGTYINSTHTLLVGHYNATVSDNTTASNALVVDNSLSKSQSFFDSSYEISAGSSTFYTAIAMNDSIVIGGNFEGKVGGSSVQGLLFSSAEQQPSQLNDGGEVTVYTVVNRPNTTDIVVGGNFTSKDGVSNATCNGLCIYQFEQHKWVSPANINLDAGSMVNNLVFETGNKMVIGGNFSNGGQVARYDFSNNSMDVLPSLSGPVSQLLVLSNSTSDPLYVASGQKDSSEPFIEWYDGARNGWETLNEVPLQSGSMISSLSTVILSNTNKNSKTSAGANTNASSPFNSTSALLVSGSLQLSDGPASVVIFDGSKWTPLYGTTEGQVRTVFAQYGGDLKGGVSYAAATQQTHPRPGGSSGQKKKDAMPTGHVVGIACAIGICCVLVLMLLYVLVEFVINGFNGGYQNLAQSRPHSDGMVGTKVIK